jgi:capsular polysaccharide transport system ATP-binding protein
LTGLDNLKFICRVYGVDWKPLVPFVEEFTELGLYLREPGRSLLGRHDDAPGVRPLDGDRVRLLPDRRGLAVGDARFGHRCHVELFQSARTVRSSSVSHDPNIVKQYCERALRLHEGRLHEFQSVDAAYEFYESAAVPAPTIAFD